MKHCPITYEFIPEDKRYSANGLRELSRNLLDLKTLPLTAKEQRNEAAIRAEKMSIQGAQPKLSAILNIKNCCFEFVDCGGKFILKPQCEFDELPENEAITMSLAEIIGIEVPVHGLLYSKDESLTYFIRRFDRVGRNKKIHVEDFAQLSGGTRETKYNSSMEKVIKIIETYSTFPMIDFAKLFKLTIFNYLIGNEDMHLKNFSLIGRDGKLELSPAYDLVNSTIALPRAREEMALPLNGKKSDLNKNDFVDYFGIKRLGLDRNIIDEILEAISLGIPKWFELIEVSFLSTPMKDKYVGLLSERKNKFAL